ncbi:MAG: polysaccharide deacetylase family protein [Planctomycetota bacterium]
MAKEVGNTVHVVFTMDCLPAGGTQDVRCPERWDLAAASAEAFAQATVDQGYGATFFVAPEALRRLASEMARIQSAGCELAVLCHPQLSNYQSYLGFYSFDRQREIVRIAKDAWEDALAQGAETFRAGFFSANDYTFHALCMEGFHQGSCSLPGRMDNEQCSMWYGSYPFAHHTDPLDRTQRGSMEFFEVPVTSDSEAAAYMSCGTYTPPHLRIEEPDLHGYARDLVVQQLRRMDRGEAALRTLSFVTSNLIGWGQEDDPHTERLRNLCTMLREVADEQDVTLCWNPLSRLHAVCDERLDPERSLEDVV